MMSLRVRLALMMFVLLLAICGLAGLEARRALRAYSRVQSHLAPLETLALRPEALLGDKLAVAQARGELRSLSADLQELRRAVAPLRSARRLVSRTPMVGYDLAVAPIAVDLALEDTLAAYHLLDGLERLLTNSLETPAKDMADVADIRRALEAARPDLQAARDSLDRAAALRATIEISRLSARGQSYVHLLDSADYKLRAVTGVGLKAPEIVAGLQHVAAQLDGLRTLPTSPVALLGGDHSLREYQDSLAQTRAALEHLDRLMAVEPAEREVLSALPGLGGDLANLHGALYSAASTIQAAEIALGSIEPVFKLSDGGLFDQGLGARLETSLASVREELLRAQAVMGDESGDAGLSGPWISPVAQDMAVRLSDARRLLRGALAATPSYIDMLQDALGFSGPKTYLVLGVDEDEIRASGGFIGGVWEVTLDQGAITQFRFMYSPEVDDREEFLSYPAPPEPLFKYLFASIWVFRDATWYADFPTTVEVIQNLYRTGQGYTVDGVVVLVQKAIAGMVGATGPVTLPDGQVVTGDNLLDVLFGGLLPPSDSESDYSPRIYATQALGEAILERLRDGLAADVRQRLGKTLVASLNRKEVLLYSTDPRAQDLLRQYNWDGRVLSPPGDYLMVVDSNLYGGKANAVVSQGLDYHVAIASQTSAQAQLRVTWDNPGPALADSCIQFQFNWKDTRRNCYWDYVRVYAPGQAEVTDAPLLPLPLGSLNYQARRQPEDTFTARNSEGDKLVMGGFFVVPPAQEKTVAIGYSLPPGVVSSQGGLRQYRLLVQKQPGTPDLPLRVTVSFPEDWRVVEASPGGYSAVPGSVTFEVRLDADTQFNITFQA